MVPNCELPIFEVQLGAQPLELADWVPIASIVFAPDVIVVPLIVIIYPDPAFVLALITLVPVFVPVGVKVPRATADPVMLVQLEPDVPTQNTRLSGIVPLTIIWFVVSRPTAPKSTWVEPDESENVVMRT